MHTYNLLIDATLLPWLHAPGVCLLQNMARLDFLMTQVHVQKAVR